jgi:hypothetical protein
VEVAASSLYEEAVLALKELWSYSIADVNAGKGIKLNVAICGPVESHEITVGPPRNVAHIEGQSPREQSS